MAQQRLQKILAGAGFGSRRACEVLIREGRVRVNGQAATLGQKADPRTDRITVDGAPVHVEKLVYIMVNKPPGVVSSLDPQGDRRTVRDLVPVAGRLFPVGRLDLESEGLVLLTNDGAVTNRLTHPRYGHEKEYHVLVDGYPNDEQLQTWRRGVVLDGQWTARARVTVLRKGASGTWLKVIMKEGRKRQIRRTAQSIGLWVKKLKRVRFGELQLGDLAEGEWRYLQTSEVARLMAQKARKDDRGAGNKRGRFSGRRPRSRKR